MLMICRNCYRKMTSTSLPSLVPTRYSDLCTLGEFRLVPLPPFATRFLVRSMRPDPEYARGADAIGYSGFENFGERFRQENLRGHRFSAFDKEMRLKQFHNTNVHILNRKEVSRGGTDRYFGSFKRISAGQGHMPSIHFVIPCVLFSHPYYAFEGHSYINTLDYYPTGTPPNATKPSSAKDTPAGQTYGYGMNTRRYNLLSHGQDEVRALFPDVVVDSGTYKGMEG